jgi:hypothetical protein
MAICGKSRLRTLARCRFLRFRTAKTILSFLYVGAALVGGTVADAQDVVTPETDLVRLATEYVDAIGDLRLARFDVQQLQRDARDDGDGPPGAGLAKARVRLDTAGMKVRLLRGIVEAEHESARANLEQLRELAKRAAISPNQIPPAKSRVRILQLISDLKTEGKTVPNSKSGNIPVQKEWTGVQSGVAKPSNQVIEDAEAWRKIWKEIHARQKPAPDVPEIDFDKQTVLAVFMGRKPTGGYATKITRITDTGKRIEATVQEHAPGPGDIVTQALTSPYHMVAVPKTEKPVVFRSQGDQ